IGTIAVGGPGLVVAGIDLLNTLNAAPGTSVWAK
ncbi:MAG: ammonium transporter, partial [Rhodococcus sp. (in: high G+C Gram-positive bacteria)]